MEDGGTSPKLVYCQLSMFGVQDTLGRGGSTLRDKALAAGMDPVRSWVRNVGVVDAKVAAQR